MNIVELPKQEWKDFKLHYRWETDKCYVVNVEATEKGWNVKIKLTELSEKLVKDYYEGLWEEWMDEEAAGRCKIFGAETDGKIVAWMTVGPEVWNNRLRIHELMVLEKYRGKGIGSALIKKAKEFGRELGCRAVVLETSTHNYKAIQFYLKQGFQLDGFVLSAYQNVGQQRHEVRLELVYFLI